jgi:hypothetical protein
MEEQGIGRDYRLFADVLIALSGLRRAFDIFEQTIDAEVQEELDVCCVVCKVKRGPSEIFPSKGASDGPARAYPTVGPPDRRAGREPVRMERDRGYRHRHRRYTSRHWRHLPHHAHPPGDNRPGHGDLGSDAGGSLLVRRRQRQEPQRAHTRRPLATDGCESRRPARISHASGR